jgi:hypothetical protein
MISARIIKHEAIPQTGSYEVQFTDGRPSVYYYFDDDPGRRSITGKMASARALELAKLAAGAQIDELNQMQPWVNFIEH